MDLGFEIQGSQVVHPKEIIKSQLHLQLISRADSSWPSQAELAFQKGLGSWGSGYCGPFFFALCALAATGLWPPEVLTQMHCLHVPVAYIIGNHFTGY